MLDGQTTASEQAPPAKNEGEAAGMCEEPQKDRHLGARHQSTQSSHQGHLPPLALCFPPSTPALQPVKATNLAKERAIRTGYKKVLRMFYFNCGCGTSRPQRVGETIYCLYVLIEESSHNQIILDLHIPYPWCHLIQNVAIVSREFYIHSCNTLNPGGTDRAPETLSTRMRLPIGARFIAMCNEHQLFVKPI